MEISTFKYTVQKSSLLDPRTKLFLLFVINFAAFKVPDFYIYIPLILFPCVLFLLSGLFSPALMYLGALCIGFTGHYYIAPWTEGIFNVLIIMISGFIERMLPGLVMGYYVVQTTTISEFIAGLEKMKIPQEIIIPFSVMFRFFPTIVEESRSIHDAMIMRGISFKSRRVLQNPFSLVEYRLIPLLISTVKIGEELSATALTRGLGGPQKRSNICVIGFGILDGFFLVCGAAGCCVMLVQFFSGIALL